MTIEEAKFAIYTQAALKLKKKYPRGSIDGNVRIVKFHKLIKVELKRFNKQRAEFLKGI